MFRGKKLRNILFCTGCVFLLIIYIIFYEISKSEYDLLNLPKEKEINKILKLDLDYHPYKTVHLDFKGAPPRLSYLREILPRLVRAGCDSLLIEYEDMFPYSGKLVNLSAKNAYTRHEIKTLLSWAHDLNLEVIPLIQTFGHFEFALKLEEWQHLREVPKFPHEICPSNDESFELIKEMIHQVMTLHRGIKYLHIGADEVFQLGVCPKCLSRNLNSKEIYIEYVTKIAEHIRYNYPGVTPIMWDDMIRNFPEILPETKLPKLIDLMVWAYATDVKNFINDRVIYWYTKCFEKIWIAGAFKGATFRTGLIPDINERMLNQLSWLELINEQKQLKLIGYVLTGWSRYNHFALLCDLLPTAVPSLFLNLHLINLAFSKSEKSEKILYKLWATSLSCPKNIKYKLNINNYKLIASCNFPGIIVYNIIINDIIPLRANFSYYFHTITKSEGWLSKYNINHNFIDPKLLHNDKYNKIEIIINRLKEYRKLIRRILQLYYDDHVINEWMEQTIQPIVDDAHYLDQVTNRFIDHQVWPRRPLD